MSKKRIACVWLAIIAALVLVTLAVFPYLVRAVNGGALFPADTMISMYIAAYTLEATLLIAFLIYSLQNNAAEQEVLRRSENAKRIIYTELTAGLESAVLAPCSCDTRTISGHLSELFLTYLPDIQHDLEPGQLHHLIRLVDILTNAARLSVEEDGDAGAYITDQLSLIVQPQFYQAMISIFSYRVSDLNDYRCVLNDDTRSVLKALSGEALPEAAETCLYTREGKKLAEMAENGHTKIYDADEKLLCDAVLDAGSFSLQGIVSGWARIQNYEGEFQNGMRQGKGCSYSTVQHHKLFEGIWSEDEPLEGVQFDVVVEKTPDSQFDYKELFQYWRECDLMPSNISELRESCDLKILDANRLFVCDIYEKEEGTFAEERNVRSLRAFVEKEDPKHLQDVLEMLNG